MTGPPAVKGSSDRGSSASLLRMNVSPAILLRPRHHCVTGSVTKVGHLESAILLTDGRNVSQNGADESCPSRGFRGPLDVGAAAPRDQGQSKGPHLLPGAASGTGVCSRQTR